MNAKHKRGARSREQATLVSITQTGPASRVWAQGMTGTPQPCHLVFAEPSWRTRGSATSSSPGQLLGLGRRRGAAGQEGPRLPELGPAEQRVKNRRGVSPQAMGRAEKTETSLKLN